MHFCNTFIKIKFFDILTLINPGLIKKLICLSLFSYLIYYSFITHNNNHNIFKQQKKYVFIKSYVDVTTALVKIQTEVLLFLFSQNKDFKMNKKIISL